MAIAIPGLRCHRRCLRGLVLPLLFVTAVLYLFLPTFAPESWSATIAQFSVLRHTGSLDFDPRIYHPPQDLVLPLPVPSHAVRSVARIGKITMVYPASSLYTRAIESHNLHNRIHGYPMMVLQRSLLGGGTIDGLWNKPAYILAVLLEEMRKEPSERLEWLCWIDADTVLLNPNIPLSLFIPPKSIPTASKIHFLLTHDKYGLNNGVFLMRVSPISVMLFTAIVAYRGYFPLKELAWRDQSAMIELLYNRDEFRDKWRFVPQRWFNAYTGYAGYGNATEPEAILADRETDQPEHLLRRGDMLVHFPGWYPEDRELIMRKYLDSAQSSGDWAVPLSDLSLEAEVAEFWEHERRTHF